MHKLLPDKLSFTSSQLESVREEANTEVVTEPENTGTLMEKSNSQVAAGVNVTYLHALVARMEVQVF